MSRLEKRVGMWQFTSRCEVMESAQLCDPPFENKLLCQYRVKESDPFLFDIQRH